MLALNEELTRIEPGQRSHFRNLTVMPLFRSAVKDPAPDYLLAEDAIAQGLARVTELTQNGSVPELRFENRCQKPVLLVDGEELIGAKQNRVLNLSVLAPAETTIVIPVSCVEAGRWRAETDEFKPAPAVMYSSGRAARVPGVTASMRDSGARCADQGAVWEGIRAKAERMQAPSPTQAMSAVYERHALSVEEYVRAFHTEKGQAGVAFALNGRPLGFDVFDHPWTLERMFPKLVRSYALDAIEGSAEKTDAVSREAFCALFARVAAAPTFSERAIGLGKDVRIAGKAESGAALWALDRYVHICAFAMNDSGPAPSFKTRIASPRSRR